MKVSLRGGRDGRHVFYNNTTILKRVNWKCQMYILSLVFLQCFPCLAKEYHVDSQKQFDSFNAVAILALITISLVGGIVVGAGGGMRDIQF